jgi:hypothetical protein
MALRKEKAKKIIGLRTKIFLARKVKRFKVTSIDDRCSRYTKDAVNFATILYRDNHLETAYNFLKGYSACMNLMVKFRLKVIAHRDTIQVI